ncbi:MAG: class I SAM-dependent RNA methyltransferase [Cyclobacteriaceae bacterium]
MIQEKIVCTCAPFMQNVLSKEIESLGYKVEYTDKKAVTLLGTFDDVYKLNYHLRTANRVLFHLTTFKADGPETLYRGIINFPWENWFPASGYFKVDSFTRNMRIKDTRFTNLKVKDAIVDRFMKLQNQRPDSGNENKGVVIFVHWLEDAVQVYFDTSGDSIARHGYREIGRGAPMLENLAAGLIMETIWNVDSHFINPMCGSGTLAIEAAMMFAGIYPGSIRKHYAFMYLNQYNRSKWQTLISNAQPGRQKQSFKIIATDKDRKSIEAAKYNAEIAGVASKIEFLACDYSRTPIPEGPGIVIFNPEYGILLGNEDALVDVYKGMGDFMKQQCSGKTGYIFTGNPDLAKNIGLRSKRKIPFLNGDIECRLFEYELYEGKKYSE